MNARLETDSAIGIWQLVRFLTPATAPWQRNDPPAPVRLGTEERCGLLRVSAKRILRKTEPFEPQPPWISRLSMRPWVVVHRIRAGWSGIDRCLPLTGCAGPLGPKERRMKRIERNLLTMCAIAGNWSMGDKLCAAPLGTAFTYQGTLENAGGPVTAACDFRFRLYDDDTGPTEVAPSQAKTAVAVSGGVFTVPDLDFGPGVFDGSARWLAIEVCCPSACSPQPLAPRVELTPAPLALHAEKAAALKLPYADSVNICMPMLELTQTGDGPAAIFKVQPQPEPPLPQPAVEVMSSIAAPALEATNTGDGPAARLVASPTSPGVPALEVRNDGEGPGATFTVAKELGPDPAIKATNSGLGPAAVLEKVGSVDPGFAPTLQVTNISGSAIEAVSNHVGPPEFATLKVTNNGSGGAAELVSSGGGVQPDLPTLNVTNQAGGPAATFSGKVGIGVAAPSLALDISGDVRCTTLAWAGGVSALGDDQGGAIELGNSLTLGNNPYIDFHRGVGFAEDYNVRLQNDADGRLKLLGDLEVTGGLEVPGTVSAGENVSVDLGLTVGGNVAVGLSVTVAGDVDVSGDVKKEYAPMVFNSAAPLAYASINSDGTVATGTPNVSSSWDSGNQRYLVTITGETYATTTHVTTVTPVVTGSPEALFATTSSGAGQLRVRIMSSSTGTTGLQRAFQFIVYKP